MLAVSLLSLMVLGVPAHAGLGDLVEGPADGTPTVGGIVDPIVVGDPIVDVVEPMAGELVDPTADQVLVPILTPVVDTVVTPLAEEVVEPTVTEILAPVGETIPTTVPPIDEPAPNSSGGGDPSVRPGGELFTGPGPVAAGGTSTELAGSASRIPNQLLSLEAAAALLQVALVDGDSPGRPGILDQPAAVFTTGWLDGLTGWLRAGVGGLLDVLSLPMRLVELLARALLTAGSGLIAPLSILLAFTVGAIQDQRRSRRWPIVSRRGLTA